jgi:hypothetical protein
MDERRSHFINILSQMTVAEIKDGVRNELQIPNRERANKRRMVEFVASTASFSLLQELEDYSRSALCRHRRRGRSLSPVRNEVRQTRSHSHASRISARGVSSECSGTGSFFELPTVEELKQCYRDFYVGTSKEALTAFICGVCGRESNLVEGETKASSRKCLLSELIHREKLFPSSLVSFFFFFEIRLMKTKLVPIINIPCTTVVYLNRKVFLWKMDK